MSQESFDQALREANFAKRYYEICERFPFRDGSIKLDKKLLNVYLEGVCTVINKKGFFEISTPKLSDKIKVGLRFARSGGFEPYFTWVEPSEVLGGGFHACAFDTASPSEIPDPPYPRPTCESIDEFKLAISKLIELAGLAGERLQETTHLAR
jgi:hypothetical protein